MSKRISVQSVNNKYFLFIDSEPIESDSFEISKNRLGKFAFWANRNSSIPNEIMNLTCDKLIGATFQALTFYLEEPFDNLFKGLPESKDDDNQVIRFYLMRKETRDFEIPCINFYYFVPLSDWQKSFSYRNYISELSNQIEIDKEIEISWSEHQITISFRIKDTKHSLKQIINSCASILKEAHQKTIDYLDTKYNLNTTLKYFDFPPNVRVACEQYLQYFVEFLRDLGINATSDLRHEAGKVLFSVTPESKKVSLDKIRVALEAYLELPKSPLIDADNHNNGIREIKYIQEVNTLKTRLSQAEMQVYYEKQLNTEKERTIQALSILTKSIIEEKVNLSQKEEVKDEKKKLLKGTVEVGKLKVREGIEIDIPKLLENTKLDAIFDQLEEYLNSEHITQLKLSELSEDSK